MYRLCGNSQTIEKYSIYKWMYEKWGNISVDWIAKMRTYKVLINFITEWTLENIC